ncbi:MAG: GNAT family N-acetyltransferase [Oscillospiraceae bacterium]|nr:GNAT family N-acetyltransferase [Oscillospiraceae bacterium]
MDPITVRAYREEDLPAMAAVWNQVVAAGDAFPQEECLSLEGARDFFASQTKSAVAVRECDGAVLGLYILHPNNVGRCGHICNASYAVAEESRGLHIGEKLVRDCIASAPAYGFRVLQFNAVVATNLRARRLYEKLGFRQLGVIPGGFRMKDGRYEDICPYYIELNIT